VNALQIDEITTMQVVTIMYRKVVAETKEIVSEKKIVMTAMENEMKSEIVVMTMMQTIVASKQKIDNIIKIGAHSYV
jgi:hypothetical protein